MYLRAGAKKPPPDRVTVYYNHEAAKKMAHDKQFETKTVFKLPESFEENKTLPTQSLQLRFTNSSMQNSLQSGTFMSGSDSA